MGTLGGFYPRGKDVVFAHSGGLCVFCPNEAVDVHHIMDRKLWPDGGYYAPNGAAVCEDCHWLCEDSTYLPSKVREAAGIFVVMLPPGLDVEFEYDKWGNRVPLL